MNLEVEMIQLNISSKKIETILEFLRNEDYLTEQNILKG